MKKLLLLVSFLCLALSTIFSQSRTIRGTIVDQVSSEPLSFASIAIKNTSNGTFSNDEGIFELKVKDENAVIQISYIGYEDQEFEVTDDQDVYNIFLKAYEVQLDEVVVRPHDALYYIKEAIANHPNTITSEPFEMRSFFSERSSLKNDKDDSYKLDEAVFISYFPNYSIDTLEADNRVVLHEFTEKGEFESILEENKRINRRAYKEQKKREKLAKKGKLPEKEEIEETGIVGIDTLSMEEKEEVLGDSDNVNIEFGDMLGGPSSILKNTQDILDNPFFDLDKLKKFKFSFAPATSYQGRTLMAIDFYNKRKVEFSFFEGTIYLDHETLAIVSIDYTAKVKIPFYITALLKTAAGFKINEISYDARIRNQTIDGLIYPKQTRIKILIQLEQEKRLEDIVLKQVLNIDDINVTDAKPILKDQIFDSNLDMSEQIFNLEALKWEDVNKVEY